MGLGVPSNVFIDKVAFVDYHMQKIYVKSDVHADLMAESIMHEILHAIIDDAGILSIYVEQNVDLSETIVTILSSRLMAALRDNAEVLKELRVT
jgi:hypothetical protein